MKKINIIIVSLLFFTACGRGVAAPDVTYYGFSTAPRVAHRDDVSGINYQDEALTIIAGYGNTALIESRPFEGEDELKRVGDLMMKARAKNLKTVIGVMFFDEARYGILPLEKRFSNLDAQKQLAEYVKKLAELTPDYLVIGLDAYRYKFVNPGDYKAFTQWYRSVAYPEAKKITPMTKIATAYDYEVISDYGDFSVVQELADVNDVTGFITFPLHYPAIVSPESMRPEYYTTIKPYLPKKPIAFFQIGVPSENGVDEMRGAIFASPETQARFLERFMELTKDFDVELVVWRFLFDYPEVQSLGYGPYFRTSGLITEKREPKPILSIWKKWHRLDELQE